MTVINGTASDDLLDGTNDADMINGFEGNDVIIGRAGSDTMAGGLGDDRYSVQSLDDMVLEGLGEGIDTVKSGIDYTLGDNVENLILLGGARIGTGNDLDNTIYGSNGADTLSGLLGNDILRGGTGGDILSGGEGDDFIDGGVGQDILSGGAGRDLFRFNDGDMLASRTIADVITDFDQSQRDRLLLNTIDADTTTPGKQSFTYIGDNGFSGTPGELHMFLTFDQQTSYVEGDTNGDHVADFVIKFTSGIAFVWTDFLL